MTTPVIPAKSKLVPTSQIATEANFKGLRILRLQTDEVARQQFEDSGYEFQHEASKRHEIPGVMLSLKGAPGRYRLAATMHPTLREFIDIVKYDPAHPPLEDYDALEMTEAHEQTQSDFKNQKARNLDDFKHYNIEAMRGERVAYLPTITGWQSSKVFDDTVFVAFDENNPLSLYGTLYLPKKPVMQSDGQTQTAALFATAATGAVIKAGGLDEFTLTLEIELKVDKPDAAQSFADRNGRGSKKNKNLVARYDTASALATLRERAIVGTVFEKRMADGRTTGTSETATTNIVDLSTMEQMLLNAVAGGRFKPEHIKHYQVGALEPYAHEFLELLDRNFAGQWLERTPENSDQFRRLYVHGWPYALKALALAYYETRRDELALIGDAVAGSLKDEHDSSEDAKNAFEAAIADNSNEHPAPDVDLAELERRLSKIDWRRYRKHWIAITGAKIDKETGKPKRRELKSGEVVIDAKSENTATVIGAVKAKILSDTWTDLTSDVNA